MPIHGEWRHLRAHAELAARPACPRDRIVLAEDGVVVDLVDGRATIVGAVPCGYVYVDGSRSATSPRPRSRTGGSWARRASSRSSSSSTRSPARSPAARRSTPAASPRTTRFDAVLPLIEEALDKAAAEGVDDAHQLQQLVRRVVGRWVSDTYRRRPMIIPVVVEV